MSSQNNQKIRALIKAELSSLWRFSLYITHDKTDAEDLVQRTCARALERSYSYRDMEKPLSWLFRIAQNIWKNELRSRNLRDSRSVQIQGLNETAETIHQLHDNQTPDVHLEFREVVTAVNALPEAQRLVMVLIAVEGFSYSETASILDVPIGTVMSRLARARLAIGRQFKQMHTESSTSKEGQSRKHNTQNTDSGSSQDCVTSDRHRQGTSRNLGIGKPL